MATWLDRFIRRVRDAENEEEALRVTKDYIDPRTGESMDAGGGEDTHIHLHMNGKGEEKEGMGLASDEDVVPGETPAGGSDVTQLAGRVASLEEQVQQLMAAMSDEEDVELEDPDTQDARRFRMRRRDAMRMRVGDEAEIPIPERTPEMIGETDLPFIEDLPTGDAGKRRRFRDHYIKTHDSAEQEDIWSEMITAAEIIAPGTKIPTFDARLTMQSTGERLCKYRKLVLEKAFKDTATAAVIGETIGIRTYDGIKPLGCDSVKMAFSAVAAALRDHNNAPLVRRAANAVTRDRSGPPSLSDMNRNAKEFWANRRSVH